jgi:phospholipid-translocating ATPase
MSSLFKWRHHSYPDSRDGHDPSSEDGSGGDPNIDPDLRLRTVRTAHSTLAESIREELRMQKRKKDRDDRKRGSKFTLSLRRKQKANEGRLAQGGDELGRVQEGESGFDPSPNPSAVTPMPSTPDTPSASAKGKGQRRSIFLNLPLPRSMLDSSGQPNTYYGRNKVRTTSTSLLSSFSCSILTSPQNTQP